MARSDFVHLHVHSDYSLLDATCKIDPLLARVRELGMPAVALTDHGNLFGAVEFYDKAAQAGVKPVLGCELYVSAGAMDAPEARRLGRKQFHLTILVRSHEGYLNLLQLASAAYLRGFHGRPRVDRELLARHAGGLVALSGCLSGEVAQALAQGDEAAAGEACDWHARAFGAGRYYLEIMDHGTELQARVNRGLVALASRKGLPLVATNDVHYLAREDARAHDALICIGSNRLMSEVGRRRYPSDQFFLRSPEEMQERFRELPGALMATREVADKCHLELPLGKWHLPDFRSDAGITNDRHLRQLCLEGLRARCGRETPELLARLDYELAVIDRMGFTNYFLIVWDFMRFARERGIPIGPGRGSAASSLVAYCLRITSVDPIRYGLLFERFLEPSRVTQPDIDIDFCQRRREEVIEYVKRRYGERNVAQIITFGSMGARAVLRDVGRVLDISPLEIDALAKRIPDGPNQTLAKAIASDAEFKGSFEGDERHRELLDISRRLEGLCRHASTHAGGVVVSDRELEVYVPLYRGDHGGLQTQYEMGAMERIGLLKMDLLGLGALTLVDRCLELVRRAGREVPDLDHLSLDDAEAYGVLGRGETVGVFQCESTGMRELMMRLKPACIDDVIAAIALFRPGPLKSGMVETYIRRKSGQEPVDCQHALIEPVLRPTYGVIVYQEQVMQIANLLAGFTMAEADALRKAMSKKIREMMLQSREKFLAGCARRGVPSAVAERVCEQMEYFAEYGFNKAHSTAYALICHQTAWLKARHPTEFMAAALTSVMEKTEKLVTYLDECRRMGIEILPPSVNIGELGFSVEGARRIRFGLGAVRNVGDKAVETLLEARRKGGAFASLADLCERTDVRLVNAGVLEHLVKAGALDGCGAGGIGARRSQLAQAIPAALEIAQSAQQDRRRGQGSLFGAPSAGEALPDLPEWAEGVKLAGEKEALGLYLSTHPLARHVEALRRFASATTASLTTKRDGDEVILGGILTKVRRTTARKGKSEGERMAILAVEDLEGACEAVIFPSLYAGVAKMIAPDRIVFLQGRVDRRREEPSLKVSVVVPMDRAYEAFVQALTVRVSPSADEAWLLRLRGALREHPGECPVYLEFEGRPATERVVMVGNELFVTPSARLMEGLAEVVGEGRIALSLRRRLEPERLAAREAGGAVPF